jgi:hypothetical protein
MADQPQDTARPAAPEAVKRPAPRKQMSLWDSLMLIVRPGKRP